MTKNNNSKPNQPVNANMQLDHKVACSVAPYGPQHATNFAGILNRMKKATGAKSDTGFAKALGLRQSSISSAKKREQIPPAWAVQVAEMTGASLDWLLLGKGSCVDTRKAWGGEERRAPIYNDMKPEQPGAINVPAKGYKISDLIQKTIEVLESDTVCKTALTSNIEAFHEYVMSQEQIDKLNNEIASQQKQLEHFQLQQTQMFQEMRKEMHSIRQENQQLRDDIRRDRDQEPADDTG